MGSGGGPLTLLPALALVLPATVGAEVRSEQVAGGFVQPVFAASPPSDARRLFVVEQGASGQASIHILDLSTEETLEPPFLTLTGLQTGGEQGLLGLAFHPDYASNRRFFVNYTVPARSEDEVTATVVAELRARMDDPDLADVSSLAPLLTISQPADNHNGGWLGFGPDGYLYVSSGDGGDGNDLGEGHTPGTGNAQDVTENLLGKLLRIDVDFDDFPLGLERNYGIPQDNPFVGLSGDDEIWAYGLRNVWRPSFDRATGDLYLADVGQNAREEVNFQPADSSGGENYGWRLREGTIATPTPVSNPVGGPPPPGAIEPIYEYTRGDGPFEGRSVTGGYVYRGPSPELRGHYFFADFVSDEIWSFRFDGSEPGGWSGDNVVDLTRWTEVLSPAGSIRDVASFAEDGAGHLYVLDRRNGEVFRIVPEPQGTAVQIGAVLVLSALAFRPQGRRRASTSRAARTPLAALSETETPAT